MDLQNELFGDSLYLRYKGWSNEIDRISVLEAPGLAKDFGLDFSSINKNVLKSKN